MDNNTAQNGTIQYPDFSQSPNLVTPQSTVVNTPVQPQPIVQPVTQAPLPTPQSAPDLTQIEKELQSLVQPQAPKPQVDLSNLQEANPINDLDELKKKAQEELKGAVQNNLQDIIPGEKIPKALKRDPKENNLSKPLDIEEPEVPVVKAQDSKKIDELLKYAIQYNASDLHISVGYPPIVRIDGELREVSNTIITPQEAEDLILPILSDEKKELLEVNKEIDLAYYHESEYTGRFRINVFHTMKNIGAAFRLIPSKIRTLDELLLPPLYHQFAQLKQGFILVTGPTGHGKSTTLAAILEEINTTRFTHIVTIEDPIEYVFEGKKSLIDQREMNEDTHSWPIALRSALRQDPDVILVGEMRDYETIAAAITLAETGHLVFATLHTNSAAQTVDRIIDVFPENQQPQIRLQLSNILEAIVAQRLVPLDKGGRRAVSEIMIANPAIRNLIREAKTHQIDNVIRTSSDIGMVSLERALVSLVREGVISLQKAQDYAVYPEEVLRLLKS